MCGKLSTTEISELICTRISHDIIGNIGAVSNAVELLEEGDTDFLDDIRSILKVSSSVLSARLKFFRQAFGLSNTNLSQFDAIEKTTKDYLKTIGNINFPISFQMSVHSEVFSKPAMLSAMILADTMIRGGNIEVSEQNGSLIAKSSSDVARSAEKIEIIKQVLKGDFDEKIAQYAPVFYLQELLKELGYDIIVSDEQNLSFVISKAAN